MNVKRGTLAGFTAERETTERALGDLETLAQQMRGDEEGRRALIEDYRAKSKAAEEESEMCIRDRDKTARIGIAHADNREGTDYLLGLLRERGFTGECLEVYYLSLIHI